jgi:hypothetical protein
LPAATVHAGRSFVTTAPAPMTQWSPMVTPSTTTTWEPIHTSSPTVIPRVVTGCRWTGRSGEVPWLKASSELWAPMRTPSPRVTVPRTTVKGLIVQSAPVRIAPVT